MAGTLSTPEVPSPADPDPDVGEAGSGPVRWPLAVLTVAFAVSRVGFALAGIRMDMSTLDPRYAVDDQWQLLSVGLLKHRLLDSVWHLHSQPPLYNLVVGLLVKLPTGLQSPAAVTCFLAMGLAMVLAAYLLMVDLGVPRGAALGVALVLVVTPEYVLFENWLFYAYPTAAVLTVSALGLVRYLRTRRPGWGLLCFGGLAGLVLLNSSFQLEWFLAIVAVVAVTLRSTWRQVLALAAVPVLLVGIWVVKDAVLFGTATTSSWLGMNWARTTFVLVPHAQLETMVRDGTLTPIVLHPPFSPVAIYDPAFVRVARTGDPALDQRVKADGQPNYDNLVYVAAAKEYLHDDIAYIETRPGQYLSHVTIGAKVWFVPGDQYFQVWEHNAGHIAGYTKIYDVGADWQVQQDPKVAFNALFFSAAPTASQIPWATVAVFALALLGGPVLAWRRREDPVTAAAVAVLWFTVAYGFVVTSLVEVGENNRFRFELGPVPVVLAAAVVTAAVRAGRRRRVSSRRSG